MGAKKGIDIADFPTIFQSLTSGRRTGTLKVSTDSGTSFLYFENGIIRHFAQPARDDMLLRAMLHSSKIDRTEYEKLLSRHKRTGRSYRALFSSKRSVTKAHIVEALQSMVQEEICDLFARTQLDCEFFEGEPLPEIFGKKKELIKLRVPPELAVMEAARRMDELSLLKETVPSMSNVYTTTDIPPPTGEEAEAALPPEDAHRRNEVLEIIDGRRDLNEIAQIATMSKFDLVRTVAQLVNARLIEPLGVKSLLALAEQYSIGGDIRKALRLYERAEELGEAQIENRMHIARLYGALRDHRRAVAKYLAIARDALQAGDSDGAVAALRQALHVNPDNTDVREKLVATLLQSDRYDEGVSESIELANRLLMQDNVDGAAEVWESFLDKYPTSTEAHRQLAELYKERENKAGTIQVLERLADLYLSRRRPDRAAEVCQEVLKLDPKHSRMRLKLASLLRRAGRVREAADEYEQFRSNTRFLRLTERPQALLASWFGLRHPVALASARLNLSGVALQGLIILTISLIVTWVLTLAFALTVSSAGPLLPVRIGGALFDSLVVLQVVLLLGVLPLLTSVFVLFHPHQDDANIVAQLALHPRPAVLGKFIGTLASWLIILTATLPLAITAAFFGGVSASAVLLNFYLLMVLGVVICAALTCVSASAPGRRQAIIDSYIICAALFFLGMLFFGLLPSIGRSGTEGEVLFSFSLPSVPRFLAGRGTFLGTGLLLPIGVMFVSGLFLTGAVARLTPERGSLGLVPRLFWLASVLLVTVAGLAWATSGSTVISCPLPAAMQTTLAVAVYLALSIGVMLFASESLTGSAEDHNRLLRLSKASPFRWLLRPGTLQKPLFPPAVSALVLFILILALGLLGSSGPLSRLPTSEVLAAFLALLGSLAMLSALGFLLAGTTLTPARRRLVLLTVFAFTLAGIPLMVAYLPVGLPHILGDISPLVLICAAFGNGLTVGEHLWDTQTIHYLLAIVVHWLAAALALIAVLRIRRAARAQKGGLK